MYVTYEVLLEIAKKTLVFEVYKALSFRYMEKKTRNTSTEFSLPPMCSDKYPYKHLAILFKRIKTNFSVLHIKVLSFKGISCSMYLILC